MAAIRGNIITRAFTASKFGVRALSQSLGEFGKENIYVNLVSIRLSRTVHRIVQYLTMEN
jgi:NAD(P)-dependent dehydrogenase (short-subunit alcohol dehydrogenase family)